MIEQVSSLPNKVIGFRAIGEVTANDLKDILIPAVDEHLKTNKELNYLLYLDTDIKNFTAGAWVQDSWLGMKHLLKWNRAAIISDSGTIKNFTDVFSKVMPGEFRVYTHDQEAEALSWVSETTDTPRP